MNADACRMPAEWEPHDATWLGWPTNESDWPGKLEAVRWAFVEIIFHLTPYEHVHVLVPDESAERDARARMAVSHVDPAAVTFHRQATDRNWLRDSGAVFVRRGTDRSLRALHFQFNGWAKYDDFKLDQRIPPLMAKTVGVPIEKVLVGEPANPRWFVLEGGAVDVNGKGVGMTTEECMLEAAQARNPGLGREDVEGILREHLGCRSIIWLKRGIVGDDTHGHVDDIARFVSPRRVIVMKASDPADVNYAALAENREILESYRDAAGGLDVVAIPMPGPLWYEGDRLPASYANFYIANNTVLVPTFNDPNDRVALGLLQELFPERIVRGIHAVDLVLGLGTLHCLTGQQPKV